MENLEILAGDTEFSHHGVQGSPVQSESRCRRADDSVTLPKHAEEMLAFYFLERVGAAGSGASCRNSSMGARSVGPVDRITDRSMKFSSSRTLPGQRQS